MPSSTALASPESASLHEKPLRLSPRLQPALLLAVLAALSLAGYLLASRATFRAGFPLDDAWIHQTYARNLAQRGEWAYLPGQLSAGSTAPLWTAILALGQALRLSPLAWAFLLGGLHLWGLAVLAWRAFPRLCPPRPGWAVWAGVLILFEWHLAWAAGSGMETLLYAGLALLALAALAGRRVSWLGLGCLVGLSVWVRPDGLTLAAPALLGALLIPSSRSARLRAVLYLMIGIGLFILPYLYFNDRLSGSILPNTFFAKQAEYAVQRQVPLLQRLASQAGLFLVGPGALLLPGFFAFLVDAVRRRNWPALLGPAWLAGYILMYALRLPVTYQHGRYLIPAMPVFFLWGWAGTALLVRPAATAVWERVVAKAGLLSLAVVLALFWGLGARSYAQDVAFIETEMVQTARWLQANTPADALVAAHDIGALGYFSDRRLVDLAGLVSPEVIPFLRDEPRLALFLDRVQAGYLVTFPGWYPRLVVGLRRVYSTGGTFAPLQGGENMAVYRWPSP